MRIREFAKRVALWSMREAFERLGGDWTKVIFVTCVGITALYLMLRADDQPRAVEKLGDWLFYTAPSTVFIFLLYASWVGLTATWAFWKQKKEFRFESLERFNFVETFNNAKGLEIDSGEF